MIERASQGVTFLQFESLVDQPGLIHAISSRHGGVSLAPFDSLNLSLSVGDNPEQVQNNRRRFAEALGVPHERVVSAPQVHGASVWAVEGDAPAPAEADILTTAETGRFLSQRFADCVPVLLWDAAHHAVATAHAGWRGTALGVGKLAVEALGKRYGSRPRDVFAAIGPSIGPCCYDVGPDVIEAFSAYPECQRPAGRGKARLDLWELNRRALLEAGVAEARIEVARLCTRCHSDVFFSHRAGGSRAGRFGSLIGLRRE